MATGHYDIKNPTCAILKHFVKDKCDAGVLMSYVSCSSSCSVLTSYTRGADLLSPSQTTGLWFNTLNLYFFFFQFICNANAQETAVIL